MLPVFYVDVAWNIYCCAPIMKFRAAAGSNHASRLGQGSRLLAVTALMFVLPMSAAFAQIRVQTSWDNNADILTAGYRVAVGTSPRMPSVEIDAGASTSTTLSLPVEIGRAHV